MFIDVSGKTKLKIGIVILQALDKALYQEEKINEKLRSIAREYASAGYDAISIAMPYNYFEECELEGIKILPSCLYTFGDTLEEDKRFSIVGIGMTSPQEIQTDWRNMQRTSHLKAAEVIRLIEKYNGVSVLVLPKNSTLEDEQIEKLSSADMIDISSMSDKNYSIFTSSEKYPSVVICNRNMPRASLIVESLNFENVSIVRAIKAGRFYSTTGPELCVEQVASDKIKVNSTAVKKISFYSSSTAPAVEVIDNNSYIEADYAVKDNDKFVMVSVFDENNSFAISASCLMERWYEK